MSLCLKASVLWLLGYPDQASRHLEEALAAAQDSKYSLSLGFAQSVTSLLFFLLGRDSEAARQQVEALRLVKEKGLPLEAWAGSLANWAPGREPQDDTALQQMRRGNETFRALSTGLGYGAFVVRLAQGYAVAGQVQAGLDSLDEALAWMKPHRRLYPRSRKFIGCAANCCSWTSFPRKTPRAGQRRASALRLRLPGVRRPAGGSCGPRSACAGSSKSGANRRAPAVPKPADAGRDLRLVWRGIRYTGSAGGAQAAARTRHGVIRANLELVCKRAGGHGRRSSSEAQEGTHSRRVDAEAKCIL